MSVSIHSSEFSNDQSFEFIYITVQNVNSIFYHAPIYMYVKKKATCFYVDNTRICSYFNI